MCYFVEGVTPTPPPTTGTEVNVLPSKELQESCKQPVAIATALSMLVMNVVNTLGVFTLFTKFDKMFNPNHLAANIRQTLYMRRVHPHG